ncbi:peptide-methionine (S)-S-oxide reductase MsrA [Desertivirga brevis]|uniref:peptide-methionine (S)-S-oxide reductase MsrA n=1 Tax=Desertivirga brevis TaxID=2810310 RepID=UPI001A96544C|nr:peptide-methionine (S)-S-oxide reductase MsrA [Pedobacter sp. SYSU D00873]
MTNKGKFLTILIGFFALIACNSSGQQKTKEIKVQAATEKKAIAAFAEGCFWCSEEIFEHIAGVDSAVSGYAGGHVKNPTYEQVCTETTGHAETVLVYYNPGEVSYDQLLEAFFTSHDPTTKDRQGPDVGSSYRSAIFYLDEAQKEAATKAIMKWQPAFKNPIVTELTPLNKFYRAEEYHQNYAQENPNQSYIVGVSQPRFQNFKRQCKLKLKE